MALAYATMSDSREPTWKSSVGNKFERLAIIMRTLRSPTGCPWDREQTLASLRPFLLEEACEVIDAIDRNDTAALREELGDLIFEVVFVAQVCSERDTFDIADVLDTVCKKLIRRHPHVFGKSNPATAVLTSADVKRKWEEIKAQEQQDAGHEPTLLGSVPTSLPGLLRAYRLSRRAAIVGFDWKTSEAVDIKIEEEMAELRQARTGGTTAEVEEELGDLLFAVANLSRHLDIEPESALRAANRKFTERFTELEKRFRDRGISLRDVSLNEMETEWKRIKASQR